MGTNEEISVLMPIFLHMKGMIVMQSISLFLRNIIEVFGTSKKMLYICTCTHTLIKRQKERQMEVNMANASYF